MIRVFPDALDHRSRIPATRRESTSAPGAPRVLRRAVARAARSHGDGASASLELFAIHSGDGKILRLVVAGFFTRPLMNPRLLRAGPRQSLSWSSCRGSASGPSPRRRWSNLAGSALNRSAHDRLDPLLEIIGNPAESRERPNDALRARLPCLFFALARLQGAHAGPEL